LSSDPRAPLFGIASLHARALGHVNQRERVVA
jgi:hypothetical protein